MSPTVYDGHPCPIPGCRKKWYNVGGLVAHLYQRHVKAELIKWIVDHLGG